MTGLPDFRLAKIAQEELIEIVSSGIEKFGQTVSAAYVNGMFETFEILSDHTMMGRKVPGSASVRRHPFRRHVIFYQGAPFGILILRIIPMAAIRSLHELPD